MAQAPQDGLLLIRGGIFTMGSPYGERQREQDEVPHQVTVNSFYVDPYEVTQRDYENIVGKNPSYNRGADLPVDSVTWYEAIAYCNGLSAKAGLTPVYTTEHNKVSWNRAANGYRLLTEAEWEYVARAGTNSVFDTGDQIRSDTVNFEGSYPYLIEENYVAQTNPEVVTSSYRGSTIRVNSLRPNADGLHNVHGNVSEWCFDYYGSYDLSNTDDPAGATSGSLRINRGGSYIDFAKHARSAYRSAMNPLDADRKRGFRIARNDKNGIDIVTTSYSLNIIVPQKPKILIPYFSYSGNTASAAKIIANMTHGDLFEIEMSNPYRGNIYEVSQKDLNGGIRPPLKSHVSNMGQYDLVLLGYPTWWATIPMPVVSFLSEYDFSKKIIIPFSSHGGTRFGESLSDLSKTLQGSYVGPGFEFYYSGGWDLQKNISKWLNQNGVKTA
jgi:formylglycine-generating enzyme required for sulfatase activity/flavodoxin